MIIITKITTRYKTVQILLMLKEDSVEEARLGYGEPSGAQSQTCRQEGTSTESGSASTP